MTEKAPEIFGYSHLIEAYILQEPHLCDKKRGGCNTPSKKSESNKVFLRGIK